MSEYELKAGDLWTVHSGQSWEPHGTVTVEVVGTGERITLEAGSFHMWMKPQTVRIVEVSE